MIRPWENTSNGGGALEAVADHQPAGTATTTTTAIIVGCERNTINTTAFFCCDPLLL